MRTYPCNYEKQKPAFPLSFYDMVSREGIYTAYDPRNARRVCGRFIVIESDETGVGAKSILYYLDNRLALAAYTETFNPRKFKFRKTNEHICMEIRE